MDAHEVNTTRSLSIINFILGIWLIISPFILNYSTRAIWNSVVFGALILIFAAIRWTAPRLTGSSWYNLIFGLWLIVAPFVLNYTHTAAFWNEIIVGIIVAVLAAVNTTTFNQQHPART